MEELEEVEPGWRRTRYGDIVQVVTTNVMGERGLLLAIIDRARQDYLFRISMSGSGDIRYRKQRRIGIRESAAEFFLGDWYRYMLRQLDIPTDYLPDGITRSRLLYYMASLDTGKRIK